MSDAPSKALPGKQHGERAPGVIGPNAITRVAQALTTEMDAALCRSIFAMADIERHLYTPPSHMVNEEDVSRLHLALVERLGPAKAAAISREAGRLTGEYLLANRVPHLLQTVSRRLPRGLSARILVHAIARNAWTFSGAGRFSFRFDHQLHLELAGSPIVRLLRTGAPVCHYFAGTFERVFREMVGPSACVLEIECESAGATACLFEVTW
jgi:divinyl protochlorophyllide a 8-vinyl-reductase